MKTHVEIVERIIKYREELHNKTTMNLEAIGLETDLLMTAEDKLKKGKRIWGSALAYRSR